ncbi:cobaltochelatase subunit CobN, partial [Escherichia coli]|uniref:cobaltochelatase subunit CobN n=2 Tax=Pseudomonadota TaxID=1224 RepID=UPI003C0022BE
LVDALAERQLNALPVYTASLRTLDATGMPAALDVFADDGVGRIDALVNTTSFAMGDVNADGPTAAGWSVAAFERLDVPVIQAIASSMTQAQWAASERGLNPLDTAMNVALPE